MVKSPENLLNDGSVLEMNDSVHCRLIEGLTERFITSVAGSKPLRFCLQTAH